jgi:NAD(P)-dependent dehydrogenase (short-subunit alcohol dehydrogenase family)
MRTALVTGAGGALGTGITKCLVADGWRVVAADLIGERAEKTAKSYANPDKVEAIELDVRDRKAVGAAIDAIVERYGRIDGLVNCAGGTGGVGVDNMPFMQTTPEIREKIMGANLFGVLNCVHAVLPHMIKQKKGAIVSISSGAGIPGGPAVVARRRGAAVYSACKHGVIVFTQSLAQEVGQYGIRLNTIAPGRAVSTHQTLDKIKEIQKREEALAPGSSRQSPLGRMLQAEDIGDAATFLLSEKAAQITGCCYDLTGGLRLY